MALTACPQVGRLSPLCNRHRGGLAQSAFDPSQARPSSIVPTTGTDDVVDRGFVRGARDQSGSDRCSLIANSGRSFIDVDDRDVSFPPPPVQEIDELGNSAPPMPTGNAFRIVDLVRSDPCTVDS